jgi:outer membrane lipoprotein-sorting protein
MARTRPFILIAAAILLPATALAFIPPADVLVRRLVARMSRITSVRAELRTRLYGPEWPAEGTEVRETLYLRQPGLMRLDRVYPDGAMEVRLWRDQTFWLVHPDGRVERGSDPTAMLHHFFVTREKETVMIGFGGEEHLQSIADWQTAEEDRKKKIEDDKKWCKENAWECKRKQKKELEEGIVIEDPRPALSPRFWLAAQRLGVKLDKRVEQEVVLWHQALIDVLTEAEIDLRQTSLARQGTDVAYVLGAYPWEAALPQVWLNKESYMPLRFVAKGGSYELRLLEYGTQDLPDTFPRVIEEWADGALARRAEVDEADVDADLPGTVFSADRAAAEVVEHRRDQSAPPTAP